jgi:phosphomannomutase
MRLLVEQHHEQVTESLGGIKVWLGDRTWVHIRPELDRPVCRIVAEAGSIGDAEALVQQYERLILELSATAQNG